MENSGILSNDLPRIVSKKEDLYSSSRLAVNDTDRTNFNATSIDELKNVRDETAIYGMGQPSTERSLLDSTSMSLRSPSEMLGQKDSAVTSTQSHPPVFGTNSMTDPILRQPYSMAPAGLTLRRSQETSPVKKYNMASDIFGTGMDKSWTAEPPPARSAPHAQSASVPASFKITESPSMNSSNASVDENSDLSLNAGTRKARESTGNPLTGQGYDSSNAKTAKRYYEGSNANQKLW